MSTPKTPPGGSLQPAGSASERYGPLISVLKESLWREQERIRRAEAEIFTIKQELLELGVELPLNE